VHLQELLLRHDAFVAAHLLAVQPAALLLRPLALMPAQECLSILVLEQKRRASPRIEFRASRGSPVVPGESLISCLASDVVNDMHAAESRACKPEESGDHDGHYHHHKLVIYVLAPET